MDEGLRLIKALKAADLPGEASHRYYSPPYRPIITEAQALEKGARLAGVNILLYKKADEWYIPLIVRAQNKQDKHSGQISLPGGSREPEDRDMAVTAVRETWEEIGIPQQEIRVIRELSPIYIPPSNFFVYPYLSFTRRNPLFYIQEKEAVKLLEIPVRFLQSLPEVPKTQIFPTSRGVEVPYFSFQEYTIWGATAMILSEFISMVKKL